MNRPAASAPSQTQPSSLAPETHACIHSHLRFGWWSLFVFILLGIFLETLHGLKMGWYINVSSETRRLLFTLAHAHGTALALLNLAFAFTLTQLPEWNARRRRLASSCLKAATLLLPSGFFLGGLVVYAGDPGLGVVLVPIGALFLLLSVFYTGMAFRSAHARSAKPTD